MPSSSPAEIEQSVLKVRIALSLRQPFLASAIMRLPIKDATVYGWCKTMAIGLSGRLTESLGAGQLDLALFSDHGRERVLHGQGLGTMPHLLAAPPGDKLTRAKTVPFESLHEIPLVIPGRPYAFHDVLEHWAQRKRIRLQIVLECDSLSLQKQLVLQEGLYAIMAASALREELQSGKIQAARLANPTLNRRLVLRVNPQEAPSQATQAVQGLLKQLATSRLATPQLRQTASA